MLVAAEPAPRPLRLATWHAGDGDRVRITPPYRSPLVPFGTFWCAPDDVRWSLENVVGEVAHIIFPATPVWIATEGHEPALAGPNHAVFFNPGEVFRRRRFNGYGDRNHFMVVGNETLDEWLRDARFPDPLGKLLPRPYLTVRSIARALAEGGDGLMAEERLLAVGHATVTSAFRFGERPPRRRRPPPLARVPHAPAAARRARADGRRRRGARGDRPRGRLREPQPPDGELPARVRRAAVVRAQAGAAALRLTRGCDRRRERAD